MNTKNVRNGAVGQSVNIILHLYCKQNGTNNVEECYNIVQHVNNNAVNRKHTYVQECLRMLQWYNLSIKLEFLCKQVSQNCFKNVTMVQLVNQFVNKLCTIEGKECMSVFRNVGLHLPTLLQWIEVNDPVINLIVPDWLKVFWEYMIG